MIPFCEVVPASVYAGENAEGWIYIRQLAAPCGELVFRPDFSTEEWMRSYRTEAEALECAVIWSECWERDQNKQAEFCHAQAEKAFQAMDAEACESWRKAEMEARENAFGWSLVLRRLRARLAELEGGAHERG